MNRTTVIIAVVALAIGLVLYGVLGRNRPVQVGAPGGGSIDDPPAPALTVRTLDVGQGDAMYIHNGNSRVLIDGGPDAERMGVLLDSLHLNGIPPRLWTPE